MRSWLLPPAARAAEATTQQVVSSGAAASSWGRDPIDNDTGYRPAGSGGGREVPWWTVEKARTFSVAAYRTNPMARAIIDTYTSFCVGDSGVSTLVSNADVREVVDEFWNDPRNRLPAVQEQLLRDHMLMGESLLEMMVGEYSGVVRYSPLATVRIADVELYRGNPMWPRAVLLEQPGNDPRVLSVAGVDDETGLRAGDAQFWASWQAVSSDVRGTPFLMPILDWLDSYDTVLSNLVDRTALARYLVWSVAVTGSQDDVDNFVKSRGGTHVPRSGSVEVHNESVKWEPMTAQTGAYEDSKAAQSVLTNVASGTGLAKTWLAEPEDANRATSLTMAEPVRRRVAGVQKLWLDYQTELVRYAVDRAVAAKRINPTVTATDPRTGQATQIPASQAVIVTGPEVAAADAEMTAQVLLNLSTGLKQLVEVGALSKEAAGVAARKAWEDYVGVPYTASLDKPTASRDDIAAEVDDAASKVRPIRPA